MGIKVNRKRIETYLDKKLQQLETHPDFWLTLEEVGRCLSFLSDPRAKEYFHQAAYHHPLFSEGVDSHIQQANLYRLAGDIEQAHQHYQQAHDLLMPLDFADKENDVNLDRLALCAYMLGNIPLTIKAVTHLRPLCRKDESLNTFDLAALAEAQQQRNLAQAKAAVKTIEESIRKSRYQPWETGFFTPWDLYEEARRVVRALGGDPDAPQED